MLVAIILIAVIVLVAYHALKSKPSGLAPGKSSEDGSIVFLGTAESVESARSMAAAVEGAKSVVYYSADARPYAKMVYAVRRNSVILPPGDSYTISPLVRKEGFDSKSFMRLPGHDAGEMKSKDSPLITVEPNYEEMHGGDAGAGTVWAGHMKRTWEPMDVGTGTVWAGHMKRTWEPMDAGAGTVWAGHMKPTWM